VLKTELEKLRKKDHTQRKERAKELLFRQMDRAQTELQHLKLIKDFYNETSKRSFNVQQFLEYEPQKLGMRSGYKKQNNLFADLVNF
jgi:hypothetical protein